VATLGNQLGILPQGAMDSLVAAAIVSITLNPLIYRLSPRIEKLLPRRKHAPEPEPASDTGRPRAVVAGWGPIGQTVTRLLEQQGIEPTIIEMNLETVRKLNSENVHAVYGDAGRLDILEQAGVGSAVALIVSYQTTAEIVAAAKQLNPGIRVLARANFLSETRELRRAGADTVFSGEAEIAMAMTAAVLIDMGATPEQLERERSRVRGDFYGS
jgi:monovalent cation:H+ antiporter-2, CPA2 family